ncbi:MAG TPA: aminoglycoside phosphotransferase family protein [Myxococcota bacterium]
MRDAPGHDEAKTAALGERIAEGAAAEIFAFGAGRVVKLFRPEYAYIADVEEHRTRAVNSVRDLRSPQLLGRTQIGGRKGIILEHVRGATLLAEPAPPAEKAAELARLHVEIHACTAPALPSWRAVVDEVAAKLVRDERARFLARVATMPDGDRTYHGDFHPGNVIRSERGLVTVDWPNACLAHPAADVARSFVLLRYQGLGAAAPARLVEARRAFATAYLNAYVTQSSVVRGEIAACLPLAAAGVLRGEPTNTRANELARLAAGDTESVFA